MWSFFLSEEQNEFLRHRIPRKGMKPIGTGQKNLFQT